MLLFMLKQQRYTLTKVRKVKPYFTTPIHDNDYNYDLALSYNNRCKSGLFIDINNARTGSIKVVVLHHAVN